MHTPSGYPHGQGGKDQQNDKENYDDRGGPVHPEVYHLCKTQNKKYPFLMKGLFRKKGMTNTEMFIMPFSPGL
jgi:hypothetical protein